MKLTKALFTMTMLACLASSCVREDLDDCVTINKIILSYIGDGTEEIFPEKICRVETFIFDEEGQCVSTYELPKHEVDSRIATLPPLKAGNYRIVCIGNTHDTAIQGLHHADYDKIHFAAEDYFAGETVSTNDSLYYASINYDIRPYTGLEEDDQTKVIPFASSHYDLLVEVVGVPADKARPEGTPAQLEMCGLSPLTNFENIAFGEPTDYLLDTEYDHNKGILTAKANIMRHDNHEDVNLLFRLAPGAEPLVTVNLKEFLDANPIIDCSKHEVLIPIRIEFKSAGVTVTVPEWYVINVNPEF